MIYGLFDTSEIIERFLLRWWTIMPLKYFCLKLCYFGVIFIDIYDSCCEVVDFSGFQSDYCWLLFRVIMWKLFGNGCFIFCCCNFISCIFLKFIK